MGWSPGKPEFLKLVQSFLSTPEQSGKDQPILLREDADPGTAAQRAMVLSRDMQR